MAISTPTLLVIDDDPAARFSVREYFRQRGYNIIEAGSGCEGLRLALAHRPDIILMDVMMPEMDGLEACRELRRLGHDTPILFLSSRGDVEDRLAGLERGADDYLPKPYRLRELELRVSAILRRCNQVPEEGDVLVRGDLRIDVGRRVVERQGVLIDLTPTEFKILHLLATRPGQVFSRDRLLDEVWGSEYDGFQRNIDPHINRLRIKLEPPRSKPLYILTVWGEGYKFNENLVQVLAGKKQLSS